MHREARIDCDRRNRVLAVRIVGEGTSDSAPLPVRDLIATVLRHDGHAFAIAHNHPSGSTVSSQGDRSATIRCQHAADLVELVFHGHLIVVDDGTWDSA
jgi:DNA repair protein RadC